MDKKQILDIIDNIENNLNDIENNLNNINLNFNSEDINVQSFYKNFLNKLTAKEEVSETSNENEDTDGFRYYCKDDGPTQPKTDIKPNIVNGD